jgi:hypothetical protein
MIVPKCDGEFIDVLLQDIWVFIICTDPYQDIEEGF